MSATLLHADARYLPLRDKTVQCVVTSPPYWGLRDYGVDGQLGLEQTPDEYVANMVEVFREVKRVLRDGGTLWLNLGDSYAANRSYQVTDSKHVDVGNNAGSRVPDGIKPKDLVGIPWRVAFALQADGWYLRSDIIWHKPNPMPESVTDRPTKAHEYLFLLSKSERYFYDAEAIKDRAVSAGEDRGGGKKYSDRARDNGIGGAHNLSTWGETGEFRNKRTVWTVATRPYSGAHFATYPENLVEPCILAGSAVGDTVLDPFNGSGTTGRVALRHRRAYIGCDINREYLDEQALRRIDPIAAQKRDVERSGTGQGVLL